jgi:uncharacterized protein
MRSAAIGLLLHLAIYCSVYAQPQEITLTDSTHVRVLKGTLLIPDQVKKPLPLVILIAGSGPTDRDGNSPVLKTNALKLLAEQLTEKGIATFRYDKRGAGSSTVTNFNEANLLFDDYAYDAADWIKRFKKDSQFSTVVVCGHSEGSLVGMLAVKLAKADGFISLAGAGRPIDEILKEQLNANPYNPEQLVKDATVVIDSLKAGYRVKQINPLLVSLFRPSVQPYLISWMKYDPAAVFAALQVSCMIVQGSTDIQVAMADAEKLKEARPNSTYVVVPGMNHVLRDAPEDRAGNIAVYAQFDKPLSEALVPAIATFIFSVK